MNKQEALTFLKNHQPLPDDDAIEESILTCYNEVRLYFLNQPDSSCIPLFLNSFGTGSGYGIYQLVEDVIAKFEANEVLPHLRQALISSNPSIRYWCTQIATRFPDKSLIDPLTDILLKDNSDTRSVAILALEMIQDERILPILRTAQSLETDPDVYILLTEAIA